MKTYSLAKKLVSHLALISCIALKLTAAETEINPNDVASETTHKAPTTPFSFNTSCDYVGNSKIDHGFFKHDEVQFAEGTIDAGFIFYHSTQYEEAANIGLAYTGTWLRWEHNPWFEQEKFHTVSLMLGGFTNRLPDWIWRLQVDINYDTGSKFSAQYFNYDLLLWGRYSTWNDFGLHIGLVVQTGMRMDRVLPILGIDWQFARKWKLNFVFPLNISVEYALDKRWSLSLAGRILDSRHRINTDESHPRALIRYINTGAEFQIRYSNGFMTANVHAGSTLWGKYRIANPHNHHPHNYKLKASPYAGVEVDIKF